MDNWYFDMAEKYFNLKIYKVNDVKLFVEANKITKSEFKKITGEDFNNIDDITEESNLIRGE